MPKELSAPTGDPDGNLGIGLSEQLGFLQDCYVRSAACYPRNETTIDPQDRSPLVAGRIEWRI